MYVFTGRMGCIESIAHLNSSSRACMVNGHHCLVVRTTGRCITKVWGHRKIGIVMHDYGFVCSVRVRAWRSYTSDGCPRKSAGQTEFSTGASLGGCASVSWNFGVFLMFCRVGSSSVLLCQHFRSRERLTDTLKSLVVSVAPRPSKSPKAPQTRTRTYSGWKTPTWLSVTSTSNLRLTYARVFWAVARALVRQAGARLSECIPRGVVDLRDSSKGDPGSPVYTQELNDACCCTSNGKQQRPERDRGASMFFG